MILVAPAMMEADDVRDFEDSLRYALSKDVVVIMPDGVAHSKQLPAGSAGVVVVGKVNRKGWRDEGGKDNRADLVAPADEFDMIHVEGQTGKDEHSTFFPYESAAAAALVAGTAALVRSRYPNMNAASVINRVLRTAMDVGNAGVDDVYGHGIVNAAAAVSAAIPDVTVNPLGDRGPPRQAVDNRGNWSLAAVLVVVVLVVGVLLNAGVVTVVVVRRRRRRKGEMPSHPG